MILSTDSRVGAGVPADKDEIEAAESDKEVVVTELLPKGKSQASSDPLDVKLDAIILKGACSSLHHRQATGICSMMADFTGVLFCLLIDKDVRGQLKEPP